MKMLLNLSILLLVGACVPKGGGAPIIKKGGSAETSGSGDDPLAQYAWHLENTGQNSFAIGTALAGQDMKIKPVIAAGIKGAGVKIAVSDSGVEINHPDLYGNQLAGLHRNYSSKDSSSWRNADPYPDEEEAHGTAVSGLIAALGWNGIGSRGVAPSAKFAGFYYIGNFANETQASYDAKTLDQLTGNFDIFNYSYGSLGCQFFQASSSEIAAYKNGVETLRNGKGAVYVKAAGNDYVSSLGSCYSGNSYGYLGNTNTSEDQSHPYLILVGAINARGQKASYSTPGSGLWVSAAGGEDGDSKPAMITTDIQGCSVGMSSSNSYNTNQFNRGKMGLNNYCNYTNGMNGTSSAAPVLSGIIALILEANPLLTWRDIKHILATTSEKIDYSLNAIGFPISGYTLPAGHTYDVKYTVNQAGYSFSNWYGFGRVNALAAVNMAKNYDLNTLSAYFELPWKDSGNVNLDIPDFSADGVEHTIKIENDLIIESMQVKLNVTHDYIGDLAVEITSPKGTKSRLLLGSSQLRDKNFVNQILISNAFYGEKAKGNWTLKIIDTDEQVAGKFYNWSIKANGRY